MTRRAGLDALCLTEHFNTLQFADVYGYIASVSRRIGDTLELEINLTPKEFRRLLDLVYIGNWVLNSTRGEDRFADYDNLESKLFALSPALSEHWNGTVVPSRAYQEGGIHEAIACYEDNVFYEILAEELSRRDMDYPEITDDNYDEIVTRMDRYMSEFELSGVDHLVLDEENA